MIRIIGGPIEARIAKQANAFMRAEKGLTMRAAIDRALAGFALSPADRRELYPSVEQRIKRHNEKAEWVEKLVTLTSKIYNNPKRVVGMPDAINVALDQAGISDLEERAWYRERVARRMQARATARRMANMRQGKHSNRTRSEVLSRPGHQNRLPLRAPRSKAKKK